MIKIVYRWNIYYFKMTKGKRMRSKVTSSDMCHIQFEQVYGKMPKRISYTELITLTPGCNSDAWSVPMCKVSEQFWHQSHVVVGIQLLTRPSAIFCSNGVRTNIKLYLPCTRLSVSGLFLFDFFAKYSEKVPPFRSTRALQLGHTELFPWTGTTHFPCVSNVK